MTENRQIDIDEYIKAPGHDVQCTRKIESSSMVQSASSCFFLGGSETNGEIDRKRDRKRYTPRTRIVNFEGMETVIARCVHVQCTMFCIWCRFVHTHNTQCILPSVFFHSSNDMQIENENKMHLNCWTMQCPQLSRSLDRRLHALLYFSTARQRRTYRLSFTWTLSVKRWEKSQRCTILINKRIRVQPLLKL